MATDCFLSHDWGRDQMERDNHGRVAKICAGLKLRRVVPWFDEDCMSGDIVEKMCDGIDETNLFLVFITRNYCDKVKQNANANDNCKREFMYAYQQKTPTKMLAVVMEHGMRNPVVWKGPVGMALGQSLYMDFCDDTDFDDKCDKLVGMMAKMIKALTADGFLLPAPPTLDVSDVVPELGRLRVAEETSSSSAAVVPKFKDEVFEWRDSQRLPVEILGILLVQLQARVIVPRMEYRIEDIKTLTNAELEVVRSHLKPLEFKRFLRGLGLEEGGGISPRDAALGSSSGTIYRSSTSDSDTTRKSLGSIGTGSSGGTTGSSSGGGGDGSSRSGCSSSSGSAGSGPKWTCAYCKGQNLGDAAKCGTCKQEKCAVESKKSTSGGSSGRSSSGGTSGSGDSSSSSSGVGGKGGPAASVRKPVAPAPATAPAPTPATAPAAASGGHRWVCAYCKSKNAPEATACAGCRQEKFEDAKKAAKAALKSKSVPAPAHSLAPVPVPVPTPAPAAPPVPPPAVVVGVVVAVKPAAGPAWSCAFCSASNVFSATNCCSCKQEKSGVAPPAPAPVRRAHSAPTVGGSEAWTCAYCKIINLTATAQCAGCRQPKCIEDATSSSSSSSSSPTAGGKRRSRHHRHELSPVTGRRTMTAICDVCRVTGGCVFYCKDCDWDICGPCLGKESATTSLRRCNGATCSASHFGDGNCLVCGGDWGHHGGHSCTVDGFRGRQGSWSFAFMAGDRVRIKRVPEAEAEAQQSGHGGWVSSMAREIGNTGTVKTVDGDGDCQIEYDDGGSHCWNPKLIERV